MKRTLKWCLTLIVIISVCVSTLGVSAQSFSRNNQADETTENVFARECYTATALIRASDYGLEDEFSEISDIYCAESGLIYILCPGSSSIVVLNDDLSLNKVLKIKDKGEEIEFEKAQGIYINGDKLYVCDTQNARIITADLNGKVQSYIVLPESKVIPDDFVFQPTRIITDSDGYTYVLSMGSYYGALVYLADGTFSGFYGANNVQATALDTLSYMWDLITGNDAKKSASQKTLPYAFVDFCFDYDGYMITCTGAIVGGDNVGQINKMSPGGSNILYKNNIDGTFSKSSGVNFLERAVIKRNNAVRTQNVVAVDVDKQGYIYALDNTYGIVYIFDKQCNLINAFGGGVGLGERLGDFQNATALTVSGDRVFVADSETEAVTVFDITDYGTLLKKAQSMYLAGDYEEAEPYWNQVLSLDSNNQLAYKGLAISSYKNGDIDKAMEYAKAGLDYNTYDLAFQAKLKTRIADNFAWGFPLLLLILVAVIVGIVYKTKKQIVFITNPKLRNVTSTVMHPFKAFDDIKQKNMGSVKIACVIAILFYLTSTLKEVGSSFLFTDIADGNYNTLFTVAQTLGLIALWSVANWLICSLFSGKGTFKEVFISTNYCLIPIIFYNILRTVLSYIMPLSGKALLDGIYVVILLYTVYLLCVAFTTIHDYSLSKLIATTVVTVLGMLLVIFVIFMVVILLQQLFEFVYSIFIEVIYR